MMFWQGCRRLAIFPKVYSIALQMYAASSQDLNGGGCWSHGFFKEGSFKITSKKSLQNKDKLAIFKVIFDLRLF